MAVAIAADYYNHFYCGLMVNTKISIDIYIYICEYIYRDMFFQLVRNKCNIFAMANATRTLSEHHVFL